MEERLRRFLLWSASLSAALALSYFALRFVLPRALPFLIAFAVAAGMDPLLERMRRTLHFRRSFSALLLTLFLLFVTGGLLSLLWTTLRGEALTMLRRAPEALQEAPAALETLLARMERYSASLPPWLRESVRETVERQARSAGDLVSLGTARVVSWLAAAAAEVPRYALGAATAVLAIYFTAASYPALCDAARRHLSGKTVTALRRLKRGALHSLGRWLRAELTLCAVTFFELLAGFLLLREPYALLLAFLITLVDALPVFGTGTVLLPWAVGELLLGIPPRAAALALLYLLTLTVRNVLEPHLLGAVSGVPPVASLGAMYLGFCVFGVGGMILLPFLLLLGMQLRRTGTGERKVA